MPNIIFCFLVKKTSLILDFVPLMILIELFGTSKKVDNVFISSLFDSPLYGGAEIFTVKKLLSKLITFEIFDLGFTIIFKITFKNLDKQNLKAW